MKQVIASIFGFFLAFFIMQVINANKEAPSECPYEGGECPNVQRFMQDYQIQVYYDSVWIYDKERLVGSFETDWTSKFDSVMLNDNQ
jgi:hypothetical protein